MAERQTIIGAAPTANAIEALARAALAALPEPFRRHLGAVVLRIEDWPDEETLDVLAIDDAYDLTGLYSGRPVGEKSSTDSASLPDVITLYRRPLIDEWAEGGETLEDLVAHVLIHEVGHHFGLSDADMHALEHG